MNRYSKLSILFLMATLMVSCASTRKERPLESAPVVRVPASSSIDEGSCFSQLVPILNEGSTFSDEAISIEGLSKQELIDLETFDELRSLELWQGVVSREGISERDEELGFMALAIIKKRYPHISDEGLKDRYEVLKAFCGQ